MTDPHHTSPPCDARLTLVTLGKTELLRSEPGPGRAILYSAGKPLALVTYLALSPARRASREHLIDLLWSDLVPDRARHALRQLIWILRRDLGESAVRSDQDGIALQLTIEVDRERFLRDIERGDYESAVASYGGPFYPGFAAPGGAEFERWADGERERLRGLFVRIGDELARRWLVSGRHGDAHRLALRVRDAMPEAERGWRLVMEILAVSNRALAAVEADSFERFLLSEGCEPEPASRSVLNLIRDSAIKPAVGTADSGLSVETVGRELEFAAVLRAWAEVRSGRIVELEVLGQAGLGKSRLLDSAVWRLRSSGAPVAAIRANIGERLVPYALAAQIAKAVADLPGARAVAPESAAVLVGLHPALSSTYPVAAEAAGVDDVLRRRVAAVAELVQAVAHERPLALIVDDLHWADEPSRRLLTGVLGHLERTPLLLLTARRPEGETLSGRGETRTLTLAPLSRSHIRDLLASIAELPDAPWVDAVLDALQSASAGSPLLVLEILKLDLDRNWLVIEEGRWRCAELAKCLEHKTAGSALRTRVGELWYGGRSLLTLLAVAGVPLSGAALADTTARRLDDIEQDLLALERQGFVFRRNGHWRIAHDEIADTVLAGSPPGAVLAAHGALADALVADPDLDPEGLLRAGRHALRAGRDDTGQAAFLRWVAHARARLDARSASDLALMFLGDTGTPGRARALVRALPLRLRYSTSGRRRLAMLALLLFFLGLTAGLRIAGRETPPPTTVLLSWHLQGDSLAQVRITMEPPGDPTGRHPRLGEVRRFGPRRVLGRKAAALRPSGDLWAYHDMVPDSGVIDIMVVDRAGRVERVTQARGDDVGPSWAPDGTQLVIASMRWSDGAELNSDLAIIEWQTRAVRQLTAGLDDDNGPVWSPDGSRIAFLRTPAKGGSPLLCWITVDGSTEFCRRPLAPVQSLLGWVDVTRLAVVMVDGGIPKLGRFDVDRATLVPLGDVPTQLAAVSPDGQWIVAVVGQATGISPALVVLRSDIPEMREWVALPESTVAGSLIWEAGDTDPAYVERLEFAPHGTVIAGVPGHLAIEGIARTGRRIEVQYGTLQWSLLSAPDTTARIAADGVLLVPGPGHVRVHVTNGGWRHADVELEVMPRRAQPLFYERWDSGAEMRWSRYGDPEPMLSTAPWGAALALPGDQSWPSGAFSTASFEPTQGLGVEATVLARLNPGKWQWFQILLTGGLDTTALERWVSRQGDMPPSTFRFNQLCAVQYPPQGTSLDHTVMAVVVGSYEVLLPVPDGFGATDTHRIGLQIFPDGTCGLAIDGIPRWRSTERLDLTRDYRLAFRSQAFNAEILLGTVSMWSGVRSEDAWGKPRL